MFQSSEVPSHPSTRDCCTQTGWLLTEVTCAANATASRSGALGTWYPAGWFFAEEPLSSLKCSRAGESVIWNCQCQSVLAATRRMGCFTARPLSECGLAVGKQLASRLLCYCRDPPAAVLQEETWLFNHQPAVSFCACVLLRGLLVFVNALPSVQKHSQCWAAVCEQPSRACLCESLLSSVLYMQDEDGMNIVSLSLWLVSWMVHKMWWLLEEVQVAA